MLLDDDGNEVADGKPGELYIRGPNVCIGYWRNSHATKETLSQDGWLRSGDIAVCKNGWFWIVDRKKVSRTITTLYKIGTVLMRRGRNSSR
jgi:4-coumarate--CoA ligase